MFSFVPRNVGNKKKSSSTARKADVAANTSTNSFPLLEAKSDGKGKGKGKEILESQPGRATSTIALTKPSYSDEDLAVFVVLALSEYALWSDPDLRRNIEWNAQQEIDAETNAGGIAFTGELTGYVPLSYLLKHSPHLAPLVQSEEAAPISETKIVKALRTYAAPFVDVRMVLSGPSWAHWGSSASASTKRKDAGMYEVRRRTLDGAKSNSTSFGPQSEMDTGSFTRDYWESRTVYLENIPVNCRTIPGIYKHVNNLLLSISHSSRASTSVSSALSLIPPIQHITLPSHHLDKPTDQPKCKGFALVVFSHTQDADAILNAWPWDRRQQSLNNADDGDVHSHDHLSAPGAQNERIQEDRGLDAPKSDSASSEARRFGLRTLSKKRWDELKEEYLAYRQKLLDELMKLDHTAEEGADWNTSTSASQGKGSAATSGTATNGETSSSMSVAPAREDLSSSSLAPSSPYPPDCLVFVRNVHTETNKTTLRALFSKAFVGHSSDSKEKRNQSVPGEGGLDYVDYNKGMDTCYLRLSTSFHTQLLFDHFMTHRVVQQSGLDDTGSPHATSDTDGVGGTHAPPPIEVEIVQGRREDLYWEKVPERVRREAVGRALRVSSRMREATTVEGKERVAPSVFSSKSSKGIKSSSKNEGIELDEGEDYVGEEGISTLAPLTIHSLYPPNCLLFVRNVHVDTNKTTLRALFSRVQVLDGRRKGEGGELDYVDYTKGTDTCHLRLSSPQYAHLLMERFTKHPVVQRSGLDDTGSPAPSNILNTNGPAQPISIEIVTRRREEFYWEKVPETVRKEAVAKVLATTVTTGGLVDGDKAGDNQVGCAKRLGERDEGSEANTKMKKRRRK